MRRNGEAPRADADLRGRSDDPHRHRLCYGAGRGGAPGPRKILARAGPADAGSRRQQPFSSGPGLRRGDRHARVVGKSTAMWQRAAELGHAEAMRELGRPRSTRLPTQANLPTASRGSSALSRQARSKQQSILLRSSTPPWASARHWPVAFLLCWSRRLIGFRKGHAGYGIGLAARTWPEG